MVHLSAGINAFMSPLLLSGVAIVASLDWPIANLAQRSRNSGSGR
jgi:hypothetical protein